MTVAASRTLIGILTVALAVGGGLARTATTEAGVTLEGTGPTPSDPLRPAPTRPFFRYPRSGRVRALPGPPVRPPGEEWL
ncbi:hypothetical protein [Parafrankia elaeagni]|uniref:hypothetical protein n=1 Tax=Parafrankia elaeagni TaxID=222534 RepID=UPI0003607A76|nr:hypothetical protein [Parafrankia elaeagni]